ncbi:MAG TPA: copper amine oxidase N-terminal domain-containing protein [Candidatus Elarobacter sp.]
MIQALTFAAFTVTLDGRPVIPRARAAVSAGHVLLPVRALGEALGADVRYDGRAHAISVQRGARVATIPSRGAVRIVQARAYAPLRAVASAFGLAVAYDARTRTVALGDRTGAPPPTRAQVPAPNGPPNPGATYSPSFTVIVRPEAGADVHEPYPAISARFAGAISIDPRSLHVVLDGRDVTSQAAVIGDQVLLTPRSALAPGSHAVSVVARDANGTPLVQQWAFNDSFTFVAMPAPTPFPISAIWIDRWISPGTNAFDVFVEGAPGITGIVGVDGVGGFFPLQVYGATTYVAHVFVPNGVNQPFARIAARLTLPNGEREFIVLPQRINLVTAPVKNVPPAPTPAPTPVPVPTRRSADVPSPTPTPPHRRPVTEPTPRPATPAPAATPTPTPLPVATRTPVVLPSRGPVRIPVQLRTPAPSATKAPAPAATAAPAPTPTPAPQRTRRPIIKLSPSPKPSAQPQPQPQ